MLFDSHIHSMASPDSTACPKGMINALNQKGIGAVFTEHVDYYVSEGGNISAEDVPKNKDSDFILDFDVYANYKNLRSNTTLLGLEIGLTNCYYNKNKQLACGDYDFILGSVHCVDGYDVYYEFPENDVKNFISRYLTYSAEMVELCGFFDVFGHIDYVARYNKEAQGLFRYNNYSVEFDTLFKLLAERDIPIEINTAYISKLDKHLIEEIYLPIYKRFFQLGGKYCTIGSDAHHLADLCRGFDKGLALADTAGLQVVYYKERKRCK